MTGDYVERRQPSQGGGAAGRDPRGRLLQPGPPRGGQAGLPRGLRRRGPHRAAGSTRWSRRWPAGWASWPPPGRPSRARAVRALGPLAPAVLRPADQLLADGEGLPVGPQRGQRARLPEACPSRPGRRHPARRPLRQLRLRGPGRPASPTAGSSTSPPRRSPPPSSATATRCRSGDSAAVALASVYRMWEQGDLRDSGGRPGGADRAGPAGDRGLEEDFYDRLRGFLRRTAARPRRDDRARRRQLWEAGYLDSFGLIETLSLLEEWRAPDRDRGRRPAQLLHHEGHLPGLRRRLNAGVPLAVVAASPHRRGRTPGRQPHPTNAGR